VKHNLVYLPQLHVRCVCPFFYPSLITYLLYLCFSISPTPFAFSYSTTILEKSVAPRGQTKHAYLLVNSLAIYKFCTAFPRLLFCVDVFLFDVYKKFWSPLF
jgi:hypothetical protein